VCGTFVCADCVLGCLTIAKNATFAENIHFAFFRVALESEMADEERNKAQLKEGAEVEVIGPSGESSDRHSRR
jgi:hypothetical protein